MAFVRATVILCFLVIYFSRKSRSWTVSFGSLLDQFVGILIVFSIFQFDADWFIHFSAKILIVGFSGLGTVNLSLISENPRSRFMLGLMQLLCRFLVLKHVTRSQLLRLFDEGSKNAALLSWFLLKIRSVRILDTILCSGSLVWLFSPAWDAVNSSCQDVGFICPFVVIDPTDLGVTTAVARLSRCETHDPIHGDFINLKSLH